MFSAEAVRAYHLADGALHATGTGPAARRLHHHLRCGPEAPSGRPYVSIEFVPDAGGHGIVVSSRRGRAAIVDGECVEVRWERRVTTMRPLIAASHLAARRRGAVLLHAAVVARGGSAVAIVGPPGAGKTQVMLEVASAGARPLAAEWSWVAAHDAKLWPLPQPVRLRAQHARACSALEVPRTAKVVLRAAAALPPPMQRRLHVDVPLPQTRGRDPSTRLALTGVVFLSDRGAEPSSPPPADAIAMLRAATPDDLTGSCSRSLLEPLVARLEMVRVASRSTGSTGAAVDAVLRLAS